MPTAARTAKAKAKAAAEAQEAATPAPVIEVAEEFVPTLEPFRVTELTVECDDAEELERIYNEYTAPGYILELDPSNPQVDALELIADETGFQVSMVEVEPHTYA